MIEQGDLSRPCVVKVEDGYTRPWHRAFRKTPAYRVVFAGFINNYTHVSNGGTSIEMEDAFSRLSRTQVQL